MIVKKEGKVSRHSQTHKGAKLYNPRIAITGRQLQECGFQIGDPIEIKFDPENKRIIIEKSRVKINEVLP